MILEPAKSPADAQPGPLVLTVKGKAEAVVVMDAAAYQRLPCYQDAVEGIRRSLDRAKKVLAAPSMIFLTYRVSRSAVSLCGLS
jgi:hypothetical protein